MGRGIVIETVQASAGLLANRSPAQSGGGGLRNGTFLAGEACRRTINTGRIHLIPWYQCTMVPEHTK